MSRTGAAPTSTPLRAAIYTRISSDREGDATGVQRQAEKCRELADRLGYEVAFELEDNDLSASAKSKKPRPAYNEMLRLGRAGQIDAIISYSNSRLTRRMREFEDLIDLHDDHGVKIRTVVSGDADLSTADGRRMARFLAGESTAESERISERVKAQKAQAAMAGIFRGGRRPFGFEADGVTVRESEAAVILRATEDVLAGRSMRAVAAELRAQGVTGTMGRPFTPVNLRDLLLRPRNAGLLAHGMPNRMQAKGGKKSGRDYEVVGDAAWLAIVPREMWDSLVKKLSEPQRMTNTLTESKWVGSGLYRCGAPKVQKRTGPDGLPLKTEEGRFIFDPMTDENGEPLVCGGRLRPRPYATETDERGRPLKDEDGKTVRRYGYQCTEAAHMSVRADPIDRYILAEIADLVRDDSVRAHLQPADIDTSDDVAEKGRLMRKLASVKRDYDDDYLTGAEYRESVDRVNAKLAAVTERISKAYDTSVHSTILSAEDPGAAFLAAPVDVQRAVVRLLVTVHIVPASGRRGKNWPSDPEESKQIAATRVRMVEHNR